MSFSWYLRATTERWKSGRMRQTRNLMYPQGYRGFESHPLRQKNRQGFLVVFLFNDRSRDREELAIGGVGAVRGEGIENAVAFKEDDARELADAERAFFCCLAAVQKRAVDADKVAGRFAD